MIEYITLALAALAAVLAGAALLRKPKLADSSVQELQAVTAQAMQEAGKNINDNMQQTLRTVNEMQMQTAQQGAQLQSERIAQLQSAVNAQLGLVQQTMKDTLQTNEQKLELIRRTMEQQLQNLQEQNTKKLDEMRRVVDEKLQKTLDDKLRQSFSMVSERLEQVYKGLGEMQTLASGVGDLKRVLTNVKTRGILGEIQLGAILEQILSPEQYKENIATVKGSSERVEYAVLLPGDGNIPVYLPIDAKFPMEDYRALMQAHDAADTAAAEAAGKALENKIKSFARDIHTKYVHAPETTDFGIMFLPVEGLYAEVVQRGMIEKLQVDYKVIVAGPTTMAALLNSLQMGFKTLAIQKRSGEVWQVLGSVKSEFDTFGKVLEQAQNRITQANDELEKLIGVRTRQIQRKLKDVTALPAEQQGLLPGSEAE